jgi:hypothetical protein
MTVLLSLVTTLTAGLTAGCIPAPAPKLTGIETTAAFFTAMKANDDAALQQIIKSGARFRSPSQDVDFSLVETVGLLRSSGGQITLLEAKPQGTSKVAIRTRNNQNQTFDGTLTIEGGCVAELFQP